MQDVNSVDFVFQLLILLMSVVVHELSHGYVAYFLGDPTAKYEGRLTLNPIKHIDLVGSVILPTILFMVGGVVFGWAKPVPYNPYNIRKVGQKLGSGLIAIAGSLSNFFIAFIFGLVIHYGLAMSFVTQSFLHIASLIVVVNVSLGVFNLLPIPPLDGSKVLFAFLPRVFDKVEIFLESYGFFILLAIVFIFPDVLSGIVSPAISKLVGFFIGTY